MSNKNSYTSGAYKKPQVEETKQIKLIKQIALFQSAATIFAALKVRNEDFHESAKRTDAELMEIAIADSEKLLTRCDLEG